MWHELKVLSPKGMTLAGREVRKRHLMRPADLGIQVVNLSSESIRRKPFAHSVGIQECPIYSLGRRT